VRIHYFPAMKLIWTLIWLLIVAWIAWGFWTNQNVWTSGRMYALVMLFGFLIVALTTRH